MSKKIEEKTHIDYSADKSISEQKDDKFQRYNFSKRIAQTIINQQNDDCLVVGVYGAWGEGKTSVINFIDTELARNQDFIIMKFNPWRYGDENLLLSQFFNQFAAKLGESLKNNKEKLGGFFQEYGKLLNIDINGTNIGKTLIEAGEGMSKVSIETLKSRIEEIIKKSKKKIVIFIDDIDRLEKSEIHSVFRLVKLTADFKNTTYILSFDEKMVAGAIGDKFGNGDEVAGRNYLEKIIQVPLQIPPAQPSDLQDFCFQLINPILDGNKIDLTENGNDKYVHNFSRNILFRLTTPRLAVRYANSLAFSIPLLLGEVSMVDLMLIEAVKIFYPDHYDFIKNNPGYFTSKYDDYSGKRDQEKTTQIKEQLDSLGKNLTSTQKSCVQNLLTSLFPLLEGAFRNISYSDSSYETWIKSKSIASEKYFGKYFTYSALKGDISDIAFNEFIEQAKSETVPAVTKKLTSILDEVKPENLLHKLRAIEDDFDVNALSKIAQAICKVSDKFPDHKRFSFYQRMSAFNQASFFITRVTRRVTDVNEQLTLAKSILQNGDDFTFTFENYKNITVGYKRDGNSFTDEQQKELSGIMLKRALKDSDKSNMFEKYPVESQNLFRRWVEIDREKALQYVKNMFSKEPKTVIDIIKSFAPAIRSSSHTGIIITDFLEEYYKSMVSLIDKEWINEAINKVYTEEELGEKEVEWTDRHHTTPDIGLLRQFKHWYNQPETTVVSVPPVEAN